MSLPKGPPSLTAELSGTIFFAGGQRNPVALKGGVDMAHRVFGADKDPHMAFQLQQSGFLDVLLWLSSLSLEPIRARITVGSTLLGKILSL
jgi:hypothetical protein